MSEAVNLAEKTKTSRVEFACQMSDRIRTRTLADPWFHARPQIISVNGQYRADSSSSLRPLSSLLHLTPPDFMSSLSFFK